MYSIDFNTLVSNLTPNVLRRVKFVGLTNVFINPIKVLYQDFIAFKNETDILLKYNSQIIYLNKLLCDTYGNGIYIDDVANISYTKLFNKTEGLSVTTIYKKSESGADTVMKNKAEYNTIVDFKVMVPMTIYVQLTANSNKLLNQMTVLINRYKLAGKRYLIVSY